jgi:8-oxo-dGTP diphosphatase
MAKERKKSDKRDDARAKPRKSTKRAPGTKKAPGGRQDGPGGYGPDDRPPMAVTVDVTLLALCDGELSVLLVERGRAPHLGSWALPGTVVEPDEDLESAAVRAVAARTGVTVDPDRVEQVATFADPGRDPRTRVLSVGFVAVADRAIPPAGGVVASGRWWAVAEIMGNEGPALAFDHGDILAAAVEQIRDELEWSDLATGLLEEPFTLGDLRRAYESAWGASLEPANFRRKVLATPGFVEATGGLRTVTTGRPAELYRRGQGVSLHPPLVRQR